MSNAAHHDRDFYAWTAEQAALLRAGRLSQALCPWTPDQAMADGFLPE